MKIVQKMILSAISLTTVLSSTAMAADLSGWAVSGYQSASEAGLVSYSVVSNNLKDSITREEFCELAMNLYKKLTDEVVPVPAGSPFTDTDSVAVAQAYNYGIVNGTDDTKFTPERLVTREEMAKMLISTLTASEVNFNIADGADTAYVDAFADGHDVSSWAMSSVNTALNYELMTGVTDDTLQPLEATSREQAIVSINRSYEKFGRPTYATQSMPVITLPQSGATITAQSFDVEWSGTENAALYHVIIKDSSAKAVFLKDVDNTSVTVTSSALSNGDYSIIVGAVLSDGSEVYSLPVDFKYDYKDNKTILPTVTESKAGTSSNPTVQSILDLADSLRGTPYVWGGTTTRGFDCSGFVQYIYGQNGYSLTRTTYTQWDNDGRFVSKAELKPGDLVYFGSGNSPSHVGMYVGNGMMIHSPRTGDVIKYSTIESGYYSNCYLGAKRIIE
ncbi:MAG: NlpC/P60 family protein [Clostridiales bacterium]|nr:NlpC/P60 family protein [Clostridiales bacterium]